MYIEFIQQVQCHTRLNIIRGQCAQDEKFYPKSSMYLIFKNNFFFVFYGFNETHMMH
jgi:hypothetical protein